MRRARCRESPLALRRRRSGTAPGNIFSCAGFHPQQAKHAQGRAIKTRQQIQGGKMKIIRRDLLYLGIAAAVPTMSKIAWAQTPTGPKLTQILRKDLESQDQKVQETIVSVVDFGPGAAGRC